MDEGFLSSFEGLAMGLLLLDDLTSYTAKGRRCCWAHYVYTAHNAALDIELTTGFQGKTTGLYNSKHTVTPWTALVNGDLAFLTVERRHRLLGPVHTLLDSHQR